MVRRLSLMLALLASLFALPALADPTAEAQAAAREAEARGAEIYAYDQAAWHSTDRLQEDLKKRKWTFEDASKAGMSGYVVEPAEDGMLLATYYGVKDDKSFAMARYWVRGSKVVRGGFLKPKDDPALSPLALRMVATRKRAVETAIAEKAFLCTRGTFNTVILPPRADGSMPAYVMSSGVEAGVFPAGGHFRYVFDAEGKLLSSRAFTKGCVNVDTRGVPKNAAGYGVSHSMDGQPTEIHVFVSYNVPVKLFVIIDSTKELWEIDRGKVTYKQVMKDAP